MIFITRPISGTIFALMVGVILLSIVTSRRRSRLVGADEQELADRELVAEPAGTPGVESRTDRPDAHDGSTPSDRSRGGDS